MPVAVARLKRRPEFLRVAGTRRKWAAPGLVLQVRCRGEDETTGEASQVRVGFTVTRKVGCAVERNRIRRRLRSVAGEILPRHAAVGHDFVIIGRRGTLQRSYPALIGDLKHGLRKLKVYRDDDAPPANGMTQGKQPPRRRTSA